MSIRLLAVLVLASAPTAALAQSQAGLAQLIAPQTFSAYLDLRATASDGEKSWLDGGFGKTRYGGEGARLSVGEAAIAWNPYLTSNLDAVVEGEIQPDHDHGARIGEAFVRYRPLPIDGVHIAVRAGLFYPPISQEHEGLFWTPAETITPSAINSWVGEEVKVVGFEVSARKAFGEREIGATAAVFGFNDTSGTLLATRGWALDDVKTNASGRYRLPPLADFMEYVQAEVTNPVRSLDGRAGAYGRLDFKPTARLSLDAVFYDNLGDLRSFRKLQWAWDTRFLGLGATFAIDDNTRLMGQAMIGDTRMGYGDPWVNTGFSSAYLMATRWFGEDSVSGRIDVFSTKNRTDPEYGLTQEHGWAITADYKRKLGRHLTGLVEMLHVESDRPARTDILSEPAQQTQTVVQAALRLAY
ncbi:hypothetical protein [Phenylobacterium montanum]|uniref:Porin n=1 Tax=Phenylobacterium montanum TaxID=2823693 RepID=A0A975FXN7_9CAUL|nr:hypothetical protein [Caulobacter sp. S6]QUD87190.1 hypothetical protein KCG34_19350 [Caulobacter sp. S6]